MIKDALALSALPATKTRFLWLFGAKVDLAFFFLPVLLAPLFFLLCQSNFAFKSALWAAVLLNAFGLGDFHVGITWLNYLDGRNRSFYSSSTKKKVIYFILPAAVLVLTALGSFACPAVVTIIYMIWSVQHLVQQNVGLLLLYHNHGQNEAIVNRALEVRTLHLGAIYFSLLFAQRIFLMGLAQSPVWQAILATIGLAFVFFVLLYLRELFTQVSKGAYLNLSALLFWCISIYFFVPFAFLGKSYIDAILIANIMHWMQYIGIMYVLTQRKYKSELLNDLPFNHPMVLFFVMGLFMLALLGFARILPATIIHDHPGLAKGALAFVLGMGMVHYLQDAFMWRFREPYYRETVLQYLRAKS